MDAMKKDRSYMLEQLAGFSLILSAFLLYVRPQSIVFAALENAHGWTHGSLASIWIVSFGGFGIALAAEHSTSALAFAALTFPLCLYGLVGMWGVTKVPQASAVGSYWFIVLYFILQYAHMLVERLKRFAIEIARRDSPNSDSKEL